MVALSCKDKTLLVSDRTFPYRVETSPRFYNHVIDIVVVMVTSTEILSCDKERSGDFVLNRIAQAI